MRTSTNRINDVPHLVKPERSGEKKRGRSKRRLALGEAWSGPRPPSVATWHALNLKRYSCLTTRIQGQTECRGRAVRLKEGTQNPGVFSSRRFPLYLCFCYSSFPGLSIIKHKVRDPGPGLRPGGRYKTKGEDTIWDGRQKQGGGPLI